MKRLVDPEDEVIDLTVARKKEKKTKLVQATLVGSALGPRIGPPSEEAQREVRCDLSTLSDTLQQRMRDTVAPQLARFCEAQERPRCAFHSEHAGEMRVAYRERFYDELVRDFLLLHEDATQDLFLAQWEAYHLTHAKLRLLCVTCYQSMHPSFVANNKSALRERRREKIQALMDHKNASATAAAEPEPAPPLPSVNDALKPYVDTGEPQYEHEWLNLGSWPYANAKGNYARQLDGAWFTIFCKNTRWLYVYNGKYGADRHKTVEEALRASYAEHRETIRRCI